MNFVLYVENYVVINEDQVHTFKLKRAELEDSGTYTATAKNEYGYVSCHCNLIVDKGIRAYIAPEFISTFNERHIIKEGGTLKLIAQIEAYPAVGKNKTIIIRQHTMQRACAVNQTIFFFLLYCLFRSHMVSQWFTFTAKSKDQRNIR